VILLSYASYSQTFPGGVKPFEDRVSVESKLPPAPKVNLPDVHPDDNFYKVAIDISVNGIQLKSAYCWFKNNKLVSMTYDFDASDRDKIISILKTKYKSVKCSGDRVTNCYKGKNMKIEVADTYMNYYAENQSEL
jgi:hypothetical protein